MPNEEDVSKDSLNSLEVWLKGHRNIFILIVMLVYVVLMGMTLYFLVQYIHLRVSDPCELCLNISRTASGTLGNITNLTLR